MASKDEQLLRMMNRMRTPFGRVGGRLGFRWVFWFTLPIPYHPWIAFLLPLLPLALVGWGTAMLAHGGSSPVSWWSLLLTGLLLVVPLSIPIFNVFAFAFRVPLLQALCILGAMVLLTAEVVAGTAPRAYGVLPFAFAFLFLAQRVGGPLWLARIERGNAAFTPVTVGDGLLRLHLPGRREQVFNEARYLMQRKGLAQLLVRSSRWRPWGRLFLHTDDEGSELVRRLVPDRDVHRSSSGLWIDPVPLRRMEADVDLRLARSGSWLLKGSHAVLTVRSGGVRQRLAGGTAEVVGNWPLFILFYDFAVFSGGARKGSWQAGFIPGRRVTLGLGGDQRMVDAALVGTEPWAQVPRERLRQALAPLQPWFDRRRAVLKARQKGDRRRAADELDGFVETGKVTPLLIKADFREEPELLRGRGATLCQALAGAKERRQQLAALVAANMLAALPLDEFVTLEEELLTLLGSRILALQWQLTPDLDVSPLPKNCPRFGRIAGFGLMSKVPDLWERLGELGPRAATITARFIAEVGERPVLVRARDRLAARGVAGASG